MEVKWNFRISEYAYSEHKCKFRDSTSMYVRYIGSRDWEHHKLCLPSLCSRNPIPPIPTHLNSDSLQQVTASDGDKDRPQNIVYFLTGQGIDPDTPANSKFDINRTTGEIYVLKVWHSIGTIGIGYVQADSKVVRRVVYN